MQLIPVIDIRQGKMVHAVGGIREKYRPLKSVHFSGSDPVTAVRYFYDKGLRCFYIADLDAITKQGNNFDLINELFINPSVTLWVDTGISQNKDIKHLHLNKQVKLIAGSETLQDLSILKIIAEEVGFDRIIFSLDIVNNRVLSPNTAVSTKDPVTIAGQVHAFGINKIIIIDLSSVGRETGPNIALIKSLCESVPGACFYPGGGVRCTEDLMKLKKLNAAGALVATALYSGNIRLEQVINKK